MLIYIIYFIIIAITAIEYDLNGFKRWPALVPIIFMLALMAGLQGPNVSKDYENYQYLFQTVYEYSTEIKNGHFFTFIEPGFVFFVALFRSVFDLNYSLAIFLFFAFASVTLKVIAINKLSVNPFLVLLFYFTQYFLLQEMTQLRIGIASAIVFVAFIFYLQKKWLPFCGLVLLACFFHYSALAYFMVLFFRRDKLNTWLFCGLLALSVIMGLVKVPLFELAGSLGIQVLPGKLEGYNAVTKNLTDLKINVFNAVYLCNVAAALYLLLLVPRQKLLANKALVFFIKCEILSVFLLSLFSGVPIIAFRISELFGVTSAFMFAGLAEFIPLPKLKMLLLILIAFLFLYINLFYGQLVNPYELTQFR